MNKNNEDKHRLAIRTEQYNILSIKIKKIMKKKVHQPKPLRSTPTHHRDGANGEHVCVKEQPDRAKTTEFWRTGERGVPGRSAPRPGRRPSSAPRPGCRSATASWRRHGRSSRWCGPPRPAASSPPPASSSSPSNDPSPLPPSEKP